MYSIVDSLIFPAPRPSYTHESLVGRLVYIPKCKQLQAEPQKDQIAHNRLVTNVATNTKSFHDEDLSAFNSHTFDQSIKGPIMGRKGRPVAASLQANHPVNDSMKTRALTRSPNLLKQRDQALSLSSLSGSRRIGLSEAVMAAVAGTSHQSSNWKSPTVAARKTDINKMLQPRGSREANITTPTRRTVTGQQHSTVRQELQKPLEQDERPLASSFLQPDDDDHVEIIADSDKKVNINDYDDCEAMERNLKASRIVNATRAISPLDIKARQRAVERLRSLQQRVANSKDTTNSDALKRSHQPSLRGSVDNSMASMHNMHQRLKNLEPAVNEPDGESDGAMEEPIDILSNNSDKIVTPQPPKQVGTPAPPTPSLATTQKNISGLNNIGSLKNIKQQLYSQAATGLVGSRNDNVLIGKPEVTLSVASGDHAAGSPASIKEANQTLGQGAAALHRKIVSMASPNAHLSQKALLAQLQNKSKRQAGGGLFTPMTTKKMFESATANQGANRLLKTTVLDKGKLDNRSALDDRASFNRTQNVPTFAGLIEGARQPRQNEAVSTQKLERGYATAKFRSNPSGAHPGARSLLDEHEIQAEPATEVKKTLKDQMKAYSLNELRRSLTVQPVSVQDQHKALAEEEKKLLRMQSELNKQGQRDFIPCLFYKGRSDKVMIHFHANGEDIGLTQPLMNKIVERCHINILCVEYPGYGVYQEVGEQQRARQILDDATCVFEFIRDSCKVPEHNIIISGRSIGSGPACHLAKTFRNALALVLVSPIKSVVDVARQKYGRIVDLILEERFNNFEAAQQVTCPTVIFHGIKDAMVPWQNSIEMLIQGFSNCEAHMFLREDMEHNKFNYTRDIIDPLRYFFRVNKIRAQCSDPPFIGNVVNMADTLDSKMNDDKVQKYKKRGYVDWKALADYHELNVMSKSQYYNNFDPKFKVELPKKSPKGSYIEQEFPFQSAELLDQEQIMSPLLSSGQEEVLSGPGIFLSNSRRSSMYSSASEVHASGLGSNIGVGLTSQKSVKVVQILCHQKQSLQQDHPPFGKFEPRNLRDHLSTSHLGDGSLNASLSQNAAAFISGNVASGDGVRMSTASKDQYLTQQKTSVPILSKQQKMQRSTSGDTDIVLTNRLQTMRQSRNELPTLRSKDITAQEVTSDQRPRSPTGVPAQDDSCRVDTNEEDIADSPNQADMAAAPADLDRADGTGRAPASPIAFKVASGHEWDDLPEGIENVKDSHIQRADEDIDTSARYESSNRVVRAVVTALASGGAQHADEADEPLTARDGGVGELLQRFVSEKSKPIRMRSTVFNKAAMGHAAVLDQGPVPTRTISKMQRVDRVGGTVATPACLSPLDAPTARALHEHRGSSDVVVLKRDTSQPIRAAVRLRNNMLMASVPQCQPRSGIKMERDTIDALPPGLKSVSPLALDAAERYRDDPAAERVGRSAFSAFGSTARVDDGNGSPGIKNWPVGAATPFKTRRQFYQQKLRFQTRQRRLRRKFQELTIRNCFSIVDHYFRPPVEQIEQNKEMLDKMLKDVREELTRKDAIMKSNSKYLMSRKDSGQPIVAAKARNQTTTMLEVKRQSGRAKPAQHSQVASYGAAKVLAIKLTRHDQVEKPAQHQLEEEQILMGSQLGSDRDLKQSLMHVYGSRATDFFEDEKNAFGAYDTTESKNKNLPGELKDTKKIREQDPGANYNVSSVPQQQMVKRLRALEDEGALMFRQAQSAACRSDDGDRDFASYQPNFGDSCDQFLGSGLFSNDDSQSISMPNETRTPLASDGRGLLRSRHKGQNNKIKFMNIFNSKSDVDIVPKIATERQEDGPLDSKQKTKLDNYFVSEAAAKRKSPRNLNYQSKTVNNMTDRSTALQDAVTLSLNLRKQKDSKYKASKKQNTDKAEIVSRTLDEGPRGSSLKFKPVKMGKRDGSTGVNSLVRKKALAPPAESPDQQAERSAPRKDLKITLTATLGPHQSRVSQISDSRPSAEYSRNKPKPKRLERPPQPAAGGSAVSSLVASGVISVKTKPGPAKRPTRKILSTQEAQGPPTDRKSLVVGQESKINQLGDIQQSSAATPGLAERRRSTLKSERPSMVQQKQGTAVVVKHDVPSNMKTKWQQDATHALSAIIKSDVINALPRQQSQQTSIQSIKVSRSKKGLVRNDHSMMQQLPVYKPKRNQLSKLSSNIHKAATQQHSHTQLPSARGTIAKPGQGLTLNNIDTGTNLKMPHMTETRRATQQFELDLKSHITSPPRELRTNKQNNLPARNAKTQGHSSAQAKSLFDSNKQARVVQRLTRNALQPRDGESDSIAPLNTLGTFGENMYLQEGDIRKSNVNLMSAPAAQGQTYEQNNAQQPALFDIAVQQAQKAAQQHSIQMMQSNKPNQNYSMKAMNNEGDIDQGSGEHFIMNQPIMINNSVLHNAVITINIHQNDSQVSSVQQQLSQQTAGTNEKMSGAKTMTDGEIARMIERNRKKVQAYLEGNLR